MKPFLGCLLFGSIMFVAMLGGVLYPPNSGRLVVVLKHENSPGSVYGILENTDGWLVEKVSARTFIVESKTKDFAKKLFKNGAFLVLNGAASYGCDALILNGNTARKSVNPYRRSAGLN